MKKVTLLLFIIASTSCGIKQKPKFIKVDNIKFITASSTKVILSANALFNNPNLIGGRLTRMVCKFMLMTFLLARLKQKNSKSLLLLISQFH